MNRFRKIDDINKMREVLKKAKTTFTPDKDYDQQLYCDVLTVMNNVKKLQIYSLVPEIYGLLESEEELIRQEAVAALGFASRLHLPEFKDKAFDLWLNDPSLMVKDTALSAWIDYYLKSKDANAIGTLYKILKDEQYEIDNRFNAISGIIRIAKESLSFLDLYDTKRDVRKSKTHEEFNSKIEWDELNALVKKYAPQVFSH